MNRFCQGGKAIFVMNNEWGQQRQRCAAALDAAQNHPMRRLMRARMEWQNLQSAKAAFEYIETFLQCISAMDERESSTRSQQSRHGANPGFKPARIVISMSSCASLIGRDLRFTAIMPGRIGDQRIRHAIS